MVTANDLYAREPESLGELWMLSSSDYNHIREADIDNFPYDLASDRVEVRILKHFDFDHRRFWRLSTVWFDAKPVMVIQNAGREGDDHARRFISDWPLFLQMCTHLKQLADLKAPEIEQADVIGADEANDKLDFFYKNRLDGRFVQFD